jgi:hypothetical protein
MLLLRMSIIFAIILLTVCIKIFRINGLTVSCFDADAIPLILKS